MISFYFFLNFLLKLPKKIDIYSREERIFKFLDLSFALTVFELLYSKRIFVHLYTVLWFIISKMKCLLWFVSVEKMQWVLHFYDAPCALKILLDTLTLKVEIYHWSKAALHKKCFLIYKKYEQGN